MVSALHTDGVDSDGVVTAAAGEPQFCRTRVSGLHRQGLEPEPLHRHAMRVAVKQEACRRDVPQT